jgi:UDP-3-O-[3-hydroxymyristoyl] glucosamine N-acyltransferase
MNRIHPTASVQNTTFGNDVYVGPNTSVGGVALVFDGAWVQSKDGEVFIGDNVFIGMNTSIERGTTRETVIGNDVRIGSQVHISHDVHIKDGAIIGDGCIIGHHATITAGAKLEDDRLVKPKEVV